MVFTENGAVQSHIGMFAATIVTKFKAWPQYLLPDVSPQLPPEPKEYSNRKWSKLSIGDWVLCKRGLDGDNSYLKFPFNFRKRKLYIF